MSASRDTIYTPMGHQQLTVTNVATLPTVPTGSRFALLKLNDANTARWRDDGTAPTASVGMLMDTGDEFWYTGKLGKLQFIRTGGTNAVVNISYYA